MVEKERAADGFLGSGLGPIGLFYEGVCGVPDDDKPVAQAEMDALNAWATARPKSLAAKIALARGLIKDAWGARGGGYASTVTQYGWSTFDVKLHQAADVLMSAQDDRKADLEWYVAMNSVGQGLGENKDDYLQRNQEGTALYPKSVEIYGGPLVFLLPRWWGSYPEVADYATKAADAVGGDEGDMLYARLAKRVWDYSDDMNVFSDVGFSWPRVRRGMQLVLAKFPHSKNMANEFCVFAWQADDHATAHALFDYLGDRYMDFPWASYGDFQKAQAWAK
jgi:hypothetical protein